MTHFKNILFIVLLTAGINSNAQIMGSNLVQNPSFEEYTQCPYSSMQIFFAKKWFGFGAEYFNNCNLGIFSVPSNWFGYQYAKTGNAYGGITVYWGPSLSGDPVYQESIKNILKGSLIANKRYCVDYYISLSEVTIQYAAIQNNNIVLYGSIGAMFSDSILLDVDYPTPCDSYVKFTKSLVGIDTLNWYKISGSIVARGGEKYIRIGKFYPFNWPPNTKAQFYVYIDDVSVCECSFDINLGTDTNLCEGESIILNPTLPNATYTWQDSSHATTYEVKQPGTYWVRAYVAEYDITSTDTIVISAKDDNICNPPLTIPNVITPNGDSQNDNFVIQNTETYEIALQIYNRWGNLIYETTNYQNDFSCRDCADGVYFYVLKAKSKRNGREKEYKGSLTIIN